MRVTKASVAAAAVLSMTVGTAWAQESAPDDGRAFVPRPASEAQYATGDVPTHHYDVPMVDGEHLSLDVWLPLAKDGRTPPARVPVVLVVSPYEVRGSAGNELPYWAQRYAPYGYAYAIAHVRGTGASSGCASGLGDAEREDTIRVLDFVGGADWSDGNVAMYGISHFGTTPILAATAPEDPRTRWLKTIVTLAPAASLYATFYQEGVPQLVRGNGDTIVDMLMAVRGPFEGPAPEDLPDRAGCMDSSLATFNPHGDFTEYWAEREHRRRAEDIRVPVLAAHGHADGRVYPIVQAGFFDRLRHARQRAGVFGVWAHDFPDRRYNGEPLIRPEWERGDWHAMMLAWLDRYLKHLDTGVEEGPVAQVQGTDGQWRAAREWPFTGGPAGQLALGADSRLGTTEPRGSTAFVEAAPETTETGHPPGTAAVFETPPLDGRLELTGLPVLDAHVSLDKADAHLAVALEALDPAGEPIPASRTFGLRSMQHLEPLIEHRFEQTTRHDPRVDEAFRVPVRLQPTSIVVPEGGRLRLTIAGSVITFDGLDVLVDGAGALIYGPSQPSGSFTRVTVHHDCEHPTVLRFEMPARKAKLLNVREKDEPADQPLAHDPRARAQPSDAAGSARRTVCGERPVKLREMRR